MVKAFGSVGYGGPEQQEFLDGTGVAERLRAADPASAAGTLDPHVTARYPLERAAEATAEAEGGHARGKLILEMSRP
ncbi:zinc-binding dehydrogenase [Kitasatospora sp. NPDC004272]